jgi:hypothetical protein
VSGAFDVSQFETSNAEGGREELPVDLQIDLLVDGELDENERRIVLRRMEELGSHAAVGWRELALRFLERQTEQQTVKQLMEGGRLLPVEFLPPTSRRNFWHRMKSLQWERPLLVAAGMLIAVTSAVITLYVVNPRPNSASNLKPKGTITFDIPAEAVGGGSSSSPIPLSVPLVNADNANLLQHNNDDASVTRRNWVITPDGADRAVVVPVNLTNVQVH